MQGHGMNSEYIHGFRWPYRSGLHHWIALHYDRHVRPGRRTLVRPDPGCLPQPRPSWRRHLLAPTRPPAWRLGYRTMLHGGTCIRPSETPKETGYTLAPSSAQSQGYQHQFIYRWGETDHTTGAYLASAAGLPADEPLYGCFLLRAVVALPHRLQETFCVQPCCNSGNSGEHKVPGVALPQI